MPLDEGEWKARLSFFEGDSSRLVGTYGGILGSEDGAKAALDQMRAALETLGIPERSAAGIVDNPSNGG